MRESDWTIPTSFSLRREDRLTLARLAEETGLSRSGVLRRLIEVYEQQEQARREQAQQQGGRRDE